MFYQSKIENCDFFIVELLILVHKWHFGLKWTVNNLQIRKCSSENWILPSCLHFLLFFKTYPAFSEKLKIDNFYELYLGVIIIPIWKYVIACRIILFHCEYIMNPNQLESLPSYFKKVELVKKIITYYQ